MRLSLKHQLRLALVTGLLLAMPIAAQETRVVVPDHPQGIPVSGCFRATQNLFGPYRLTFCLERRGSYQVRGGNLSCDGRLFWHTSGRDIFIDLERTSCGRGRAWEEATMDCRHTGNLISRLAGQALGIPLLNSLRCTYHPSVRGVSRRTFTAVRL
ncbi:hypothetical protein SAMN05428969_2985 [Devosia sp. YR412]|uniref:hypothetical protein n=1 Tax=Devosia sp. YR412 TaxID=1881030 RepID=UPI0008CBC1C8|nr:hypothetical protein [Devosia sp. YR412]SEQ41347.1 hypothetical protein SAMN05428969_2985 [Devosia sp. YR412]